MSGKLRNIFLIVFCILVVACAAYLAFDDINRYRARAELSSLAGIVAQAQAQSEAEAETETEAAADSPSPVPEPAKPAIADEPVAATGPIEAVRPPILPKYRTLYSQNRDLVGWLKIEGTVIDYPVMQTPQEEDYYLHKGWNGEYSVYGLLYIDEKCDVDESDNVIIYGHNMRDGSMFGDLLDFESRSYWEKHPTFTFDTIYEEREYEIVAVFRSRVLYKNEEGFRYYSFIDALNKKEFDSYIASIKELSVFDTGITPEYGDRFVTLSTCAYHTENGRFVVVARQINHRNGPTAGGSLE